MIKCFQRPGHLCWENTHSVLLGDVCALARHTEQVFFQPSTLFICGLGSLKFCKPVLLQACVGQRRSGTLDLSRFYFGLTELVFKGDNTGLVFQYCLFARFQSILPFATSFVRGSWDKNQSGCTLTKASLYTVCSRRISRSMSPRRRVSSTHSASCSRA